MTAPAPLLILDSATLYYRAFYALPEKMTAPDGHPHNAIRGFLSMLTTLTRLHRPSGIVAAWDTDWRPQWRVDLVPTYKTHRVEPESDQSAAEEIPDTLGPQIGALAEIIDALGIARIGFENFEADDVIASVADQSPGRHLVVTSDKDLMQVISERTSILLQSQGGLEKWPIIGEAEVLARFGVTVDQYLDYAVLKGDPSDGLPGIAGIGDKTAAALISGYGSLDQLIKAASASAVQKPLTPTLAARIVNGTEYLVAAREVITAEQRLPISEWSFAAPGPGRNDKQLGELAAEWGVERFVAELDQALAG
ncbi:MAG: 5'-3' exonuclease [Candidatus Nanopelagicales bacterium]|nr:5'-3' exonuclease [Candidatus Nanopelagicales bacterium]MCF8550704.1 5'-3' exonuclease [Candidatus Nanopelagicales bacterium]